MAVSIATVYRLMDDIALQTGDGDPVYLSVHQASVLSDTLARAAIEAATVPFTKSEFGTVSIRRDARRRNQG
jgi:hypothetical protein